VEVLVVAAVGLLGVVVGGVLSGLVTIQVERVREGHAARVAARLLQDDFENVVLYVDALSESGRYGPSVLAHVKTDEWREQRALIALPLEIEEWDVLSVAARRWGMLAAKLEGFEPGRSLSADDRQQLDVLRGDMRRAIPLLRSVGRGERVPTAVPLPWRRRGEQRGGPSRAELSQP
jgi:hypothetical protein